MSPLFSISILAGSIFLSILGTAEGASFRTTQFHRARQFDPSQTVSNVTTSGTGSCDTDRLTAVTGLLDAGLQINALAVSAASDPDPDSATAAVSAAIAVISAQAAAVNIVSAVLQNLTAPPDQVAVLGAGVSNATLALTSLNSTDTNVTQLAGAALTALQAVSNAGSSAQIDCN